MVGMTVETALMRPVTSILQPAREHRKERTSLGVEGIYGKGQTWLKPNYITLEKIEEFLS